MDRKFFIVSNPYAGTGKSQTVLKKLKKRLDKEQFYYAVFLTPLSENLPDFIEENLFTDSTDVVVIGGDGTINATVNAIGNKDVILHVLPCGTGDDFVKTIDIGNSLEEQIETIISGQVKTIDLGECNDRKFINGVGLGFDGQIVYDMLNKKSLFTGFAKYYFFVLKILGSYRSRPIEWKLDGQKIVGRIIIMAIHNGTTFGGGFKLNPEGKIDDGLLNVCTIDRMPAWKRFLNIGKLSYGKHGKLPEVRFYQGEKIEIEECSRPIHAHMDGEYYGQPPFNISILPHALKVRVKR